MELEKFFSNLLRFLGNFTKSFVFQKIYLGISVQPY